MIWRNKKNRKSFRMWTSPGKKKKKKNRSVTFLVSYYYLLFSTICGCLKSKKTKSFKLWEQWYCSRHLIYTDSSNTQTNPMEGGLFCVSFSRWGNKPGEINTTQLTRRRARIRTQEIWSCQLHLSTNKQTYKGQENTRELLEIQCFEFSKPNVSWMTKIKWSEFSENI